MWACYLLFVLPKAATLDRVYDVDRTHGLPIFIRRKQMSLVEVECRCPLLYGYLITTAVSLCLFRSLNRSNIRLTKIVVGSRECKVS
jgi:hypothetical protein